MTSRPGDADREFVCVGRAEDLARFLAEYGLAPDDVEGLIAARTPPGTGGKPGPPEFMVHRSLLRSHGDFPCAGEICGDSSVELIGCLPRVSGEWDEFMLAHDPTFRSPGAAANMTPPAQELRRGGVRNGLASRD